MSNDKYGSMFDDEELGSTIPPVNDSGPKQTPIADPGLLNDEARELIEAKTKAAVETSKQAAKAGLAATVRATKQLVEKARETKTRVQANPSAGKRNKIITISLVAVVLVAAVAWFVFKPGDKSEADESVAPAMPVIPAMPVSPVGTSKPDPLPAVEVEEPAVDISAPLVEPVMEPEAPSSTDFVIPAPGYGAVVPTQEKKPVAKVQAPVPPAPEVITKTAKTEPAHPAPSVREPVAKPAAVVARQAKSKPVRPVPVAKPVVGAEEQKQIDAIKAFGSSLSGN